MSDAAPPNGRSLLLLRLAGPAAGLLAASIPIAGLPPEASRVLGVTVWMVLWWITEAVPLAATSLLPIVLFPILGISSTRDAAAPFANEIIFLFLAGFFLATALEAWRSHARIAYTMILAIGTSGRRVILGVMVATAFLSMWISNTATAALMYPITLAIGVHLGLGVGADRTRTALMLGMAYAASIGGMASLIGTPPNLIFAGAATELTGQSIGFGQFMQIGLPITAILLPLCWVLLVYVLFRGTVDLGPGARAELRQHKADLGPIEGGERLVLGIFVATALAWLLREPKTLGSLTIPGLATWIPGISDAAIGVGAAVLLFAFRGRTRDGARRPLLEWSEARQIPWEVLLLFGGGLALADAMGSSGLTVYLGSLLEGLRGAPTIVVYAGLAAMVLFLGELASNTAVAAMVMPLAATLGTAIGRPPLELMLVATFAASTGFALPIATPPNTIAFGSGLVTIRQMAKAGVLLDLVAIGVIVAVLSVVL